MSAFPTVVALTMVAAAGAVVISRGAVVVTVNGSSMAPTYAHGDRLLALRRQRWQTPRVGQVVVGRFQPEPSSPLLVKRVRAVDGEHVRIDLSPLSAALTERLRDRAGQQDVLDVDIPPGMILVTGDAPESADGVLWGPVPIDRVTAVVVARMPPARRSRA